MARLRPEFKAKLIEKGAWYDFKNRRQSLLNDGLSPSKALSQTVLEFMGEAAAEAIRARVPLANPEVLPEKLPLNLDDVVGASRVGGGQAPEDTDWEGSGDSLVAGDLKKAGPDSVLWVASNLDRKDVCPEECPDKAAWNLWVECSRNPPFRAEVFWKTMFMKAVSESGKGGPDTTEIDGASQVEVIDQLLEFHDNAENPTAG